MHNVLRVKSYFLELQESICQELAKEDGKASFHTDLWQLPDLGYGQSRVITNGDVFEKGGVNFSHAVGAKLPESALGKRPELKNYKFEVMGVSVVVHPLNPYVPTSHANFRFFMATKKNAPSIWWFGGGFDLTPYYGFEDDCIYWHTVAKNACDAFGHDVYGRYKKWCDDYFYLQHRNEPRGIGGLFFDNLNDWDFETCFSFIKSTSIQYMKAYIPIVAKRKQTSYGEREKNFQLYRRGRYVEFNLLYDRGTAFGLQTKGRVESILMSLPPMATWTYDWQPEPGSAEEKLYTHYLINKDWV